MPRIHPTAIVSEEATLAADVEVGAFALIGAGVGPMVVVGLAAVAGTWVYGYLRPSLPH